MTSIFNGLECIFMANTMLISVLLLVLISTYLFLQAIDNEYDTEFSTLMSNALEPYIFKLCTAIIVSLVYMYKVYEKVHVPSEPPFKDTVQRLNRHIRQRYNTNREELKNR